jgi:beta-glucosidase
MDRRDFLKTVGALAVVLALSGGLVAAISGQSDAEIEKRVQDVLSRMTLDEKVEQMSGNVLRDMVQAFSARGHGYTGFTPANKRLGIPALKCLDGPRGVGFFYKTTCFPVSAARGSTWDAELEERVGAAMGYETRAVGANMLLCPCINVVRHPSMGRAQESYGEDPYHLGVMGAGLVVGLQKHVMSCPKHYAVNNIEESRMFVNVRVDERTLREIYLPHFRMCVEAGAASIMSAYNDVNGYLCGHNTHLLRDILKGDWNFDGFVVSDWVNAVEDTAEAANAGLDLEMPRPEYYGKHLKKAVLDGRVSEAVIDEAVSRLLRQKFRFDISEAGYDRNKVAGREHAELAREVAQKSMVLLKNSASALPLDRTNIRTIAVVGKLADKANIGDLGSSNVTPPYAVTPLEGIRTRAGDAVEVVYEAGGNLSAARRIAGEADAVIVVAGLTYKDEGEGNDREDLNLHKEDEQLIKAVAEENERCIVVLEGGAAITMESWKDKVQAILMAWYPGMEGGNAIADVLFGDVNPSGKLAVVFPKSLDQLFKHDNKSKTVEYDYYHGYRYFDKKGLEPAFPFGFGLSYTEYKYGNLRLNKKKTGRSGKIKVKVDVTNIGKVSGEEIVQLYIGYKGSRIDRPVKDLKGFGRLALEPGQTKTLSLEVKAEDLAYYNMDSEAWEIEEIEYVVYVGPCSRQEDLLSDTFRVAGP